MSNLNGKVAVVTGGNSGIGLATAQRFVKEGAYVFITGRRQAELDKAVALIGGNVEAVEGDLTITADIERLFETVRSRKGKLDILVANAGTTELVPFEDITEEHFDMIFNLNARATLFTVQKALPLMAIGGAIVLMGSAAGSVGTPGYAVYNATKAGIRSYSRTLANELAARGIRVNTLSPGPIDTPLLDGAPAELKKKFTELIPLGRSGRPEEVAAAALFLASDESSFITGAELSVDGGMNQV